MVHFHGGWAVARASCASRFGANRQSSDCWHQPHANTLGLLNHCPDALLPAQLHLCTVLVRSGYCLASSSYCLATCVDGCVCCFVSRGGCLFQEDQGQDHELLTTATIRTIHTKGRTTPPPLSYLRTAVYLRKALVALLSLLLSDKIRQVIL
jgi:hypothetical protein